jgi:hypothetical protein
VLIGPLGLYLRDADRRPRLADQLTTSLLAFHRRVSGVGACGGWGGAIADRRRALILSLRSSRRHRLSSP